MQNSRYPKIGLRSKNELAKRIADKSFPYKDALALINDVLKNKDQYWYDSKGSEPAKGKYVRSAHGKPLGKLLKLIDGKVLCTNDKFLPPFIYGGLSGSDHVRAAQSLIGIKKKRMLLSADVQSFFEQVEKKRIFYFFYKKCDCSAKVSRILAELCSVQEGPKGSKSERMILARGFATSTRLAVWCNLDAFYQIFWKAKEILKGKDSKVAIFIDDLGVSASNVPEELMEYLYKEIEFILNSSDTNQPLRLNSEKKKIQNYKKGMEHLGLNLGKNGVMLGYRTKSKIDRIKDQLSKGKGSIKNKISKRGLMSYKRYVASVAMEQK